MLASKRHYFSLPCFFYFFRFFGLGLFLALFCFSNFSEDQLVIIQATSKEKQSFIIRKGAPEGISRGQESLFSTRNASFAAICQEVNRFFSLWTIKDRKGQIPFGKGDYVTYTNNIKNVWSEIPKLQFAPQRDLIFKKSSEWIIRGNYSYAISESISDTTEDKTTDRVGYQLELLYANRFSPRYEWGIGLRVDRENATLSQPVLDVPTNRYMLTGELLYHFDKKTSLSKGHYYVGLALAYGLSYTTVNKSISTGTTLIAPIAKVGYINPVSLNYSLLFEGTIESLSQKESFKDTADQATNIVNSKFSIGVRF